MQVVEFAAAGARAQVLLTYGNASRPGSPHISDQLPLFERKVLRPALRERSEIERSAVRREHY